MATAATSGAAADAAAQAANHARRLLVGGLMIETPEDTFRELARKTGSLVLTGVKGTFRKKRLYFMPYNGITFYCKTDMDKRVVTNAIEVPKIDDGPLDL